MLQLGELRLELQDLELLRERVELRVKIRVSECGDDGRPCEARPRCEQATRADVGKRRACQEGMQHFRESKILFLMGDH
jgi:hypothetical protein